MWLSVKFVQSKGMSIEIWIISMSIYKLLNLQSSLIALPDFLLFSLFFFVGWYYGFENYGSLQTPID